jgi:CRISPR/Cas system-associated exonuclease Cas4 (RecB family)
VPAEDFRNVEVLDSLLIDGQTVYVKPDLAFIHPDDGLLWLVDWKTGRARLEDDLQLATYALFAQSKWGAEPEQVRGVLSYLATGEERRVELGATALDEAREKIRSSMSEMRSLLHDVDENVALREDFPQTEDKNRCPRCNFRQFCEGSAGIPGAELAGDPP